MTQQTPKLITQKESTCDTMREANGGAVLQIIDDPKTIPRAAKMRLVETFAQYIVKRIRQEGQQ